MIWQMQARRLTQRRLRRKKRLLAERTKDRRTYIPDVDILEDANNLYIYADMPGADDKGVNITLENDVLTIEAQVGDLIV